MTLRVDVAPHMLRWARDRARLEDDDFRGELKDFPQWVAGTRQPTFKQFEKFAAKTHTPSAYLLLDEPPDDALPIPDFRTIRDAGVTAPSVDLLDTVHLCQRRQAWYSDHAQSESADPIGMVGSLSMAATPEAAAARLADLLQWDSRARAHARNWSDALATLRENAEAIGVLVMINGVVGNNTHRRLDPDEFRGFALADPFAPVVFVNGADTKAAQVFTLAHELAHLLIAQSGVSDLEPESVQEIQVERWCNRVAAEFLVPGEEFRAVHNDMADFPGELDRLAAHFRVSTLVILGRLRELGYIDWTRYRRERRAELERIAALPVSRAGSGGNAYYTIPVRTSRRFAEAVVASTLEGRTLYRDAFRLLGVKSQSTFDGLARRLGII